jgi:hemolysin D
MSARLLKFNRPRPEKPSPAEAPAYEQAGLSEVEREFLPHLLEIEETPPPTRVRALLWTIVAALAVFGIWSVVGQIDIVATAPGKLIPDGRVKVIQPIETSVVKAIHAREGQHVKEGDLLIELDPALSQADLQSASVLYEQHALERARLVAELKGGRPGYRSNAGAETVELQEALREARVAAYQMRLSAAQAAVEERASAVSVAEAQLKKAEITLEIAREREQKMATLLQAQFISRMEYLKHLQELESAKHDLDAQQKTVEQQRHAHRQALDQYNGVRQEWRASVLSDLDKEVQAHPGLLRDKEKSERINDLKTLRAPVAGYVQSVGVATLGGVVTPAQNLVTIVPEDTPLLVEANLSNDDIGYVRIGQKVDIKVDTYPFQKYGVLSGTLVWVSADAELRSDAERQSQDPKTAGASSDSGGQQSTKALYSYKVHVRPDPESRLLLAGQAAPLQAGMTVQADIRTDRRRVIEFFLSPVIKYMDEGLKVR